MPPPQDAAIIDCPPHRPQFRVGLPEESELAEPILCIGPRLDAVGGMAEVVRQMAGLTFDGHYHLRPFANTQASSDREWRASKVARHLVQSFRLAGAIRRSRARLAHIHTCSGPTFFRSAADLLTAQQFGCQTVLHLHGGAFESFYEASMPGARRLIRAVLSAADALVALSDDWRRILERIAPRANIVVIENAVAVPDVPPRRQAASRCRFLFLARMDRAKGVLDLLDAAAECRRTGTDFELTLAGAGGTVGSADSLDRHIAARGIDRQVRYVGELHGDAKQAAFQRADALVLPSHFEGMPLCILEAMAQGLPVIATTVGAIPEVIADGCQGCLVPPSRADLLAHAMARLATDAPLRAAMGENAHRLAASRFSLPRFESQVVRLYDRLLR